MPGFILRSAPDEDWYVEWSTVVDAPVAQPGTRAEYAAALGEDRVARAEATGTSMNDPACTRLKQPPWFSFEQDTMMTAEGNPIPGQGWIYRKDLRAYVEAMIAGDQAGMLAVHHEIDEF